MMEAVPDWILAMFELKKGALYVVATPIGNLGDLSPRARDVLAGADLICAEDTRHTRQMLNALGMDRPLLALHEHNESARVAQVLAQPNPTTHQRRQTPTKVAPHFRGLAGTLPDRWLQPSDGALQRWFHKSCNGSRTTACPECRRLLDLCHGLKRPHDRPPRWVDSS